MLQGARKIFTNGPYAPEQAGLAGILGLAGSENVQVRPGCMHAVSSAVAGLDCDNHRVSTPTCMLQGEDQKKLDVLANEVFINVLRRCGQCSVLVRLLPSAHATSTCIPCG
jgi:hypothetical protein